MKEEPVDQPTQEKGFKEISTTQKHSGRPHHHLYGESFGMPYYLSHDEGDQIDSSCLHQVQEEHIKSVNWVKTRTITLNELQNSLDASLTNDRYASASPYHNRGSFTPSPSRARMTPLPQSADHYTQRKALMTPSSSLGGGVSSRQIQFPSNVKEPTPLLDKDDEDPLTPGRQEQEQGLTSLRFTQNYISGGLQIAGYSGSRSEGGSSPGSPLYARQSPRLMSRNQMLNQGRIYSPSSQGFSLGTENKDSVMGLAKSVNCFLPAPEIERLPEEDQHLLTADSPIKGGSQRLEIDSILSKQIESRQSSLQNTAKKRPKSKHSRRHVSANAFSNRYRSEERSPSANSISEPSSLNRKHQRNSTFAMLDFSMPKFDSEEKSGPGQGIISLNRLLINTNINQEGEIMEGTAQFQKDKVEESVSSSLRHQRRKMELSPAQSKFERSQSQDTLIEVNLFDKEKLEQHLEDKKDSRESTPAIAKKTNSFKAKVKAIVALAHKKKTPLEVKPEIRDTQDEVLRYGLLVEIFAQHPFLSHRECPAVLYAQDLLDGTVSLSNNSDIITPASEKGDDRFIVIPRNVIKSRNKISKQIALLHQFRERKGKHIPISDEINDGVYIRENVENLLAEVRENCDDYFQNIGQPVHYGAEVHICHLKSKRFVTVRKREKEVLRSQLTSSTVGGAYISPAKTKANAVKFMPYELELKSELSQQSVFKFLPLFRYQQMGEEIRVQEPFVLSYTPQGSGERQAQNKQFSVFYVQEMAFAAAHNKSSSPSVYGKSPKSIKSGLISLKHEEEGIGSPLLLQENGRTQFKFRYALKQDLEASLTTPMFKELKIPENPLLLLHTKVLLIKNIDAESFFTLNITTRQKQIMDKCRKIKRKITSVMNTKLEFLQSSTSSKVPTPKGSGPGLTVNTPDSSLIRVSTANPSQFTYQSPFRTQLSMQTEKERRYTFNHKKGQVQNARELIRKRMEDLRSNKGTTDHEDSSRSQTHAHKHSIDSRPLQDIFEDEKENAISPKAKEARIKDKQREKFAKKIIQHQSPQLTELVYNHPSYFNKKGINMFFAKESQHSQASNLWEVMINPEDPSTLLFRHLLFNVTLKPLKPVFIDLFDKHSHKVEKKKQEILVKLHLQSDERKFLHVLANKYNPVDHQFHYTKFGILQSQDKSGLSDLFALQPPLDPSTSLSVKFVQMCSAYLYKRKSFVPFTKELDRLYDILSKIKLFTTNSLPQYFDDGFNYGAISQRHQSLIKEALILQRLFEILSEIVEYIDRPRYSDESDFQDSGTWSCGLGENAATVRPEEVITMILDICILNITQHKENTKYVLIYLFPKHLLKEKVFLPFSPSIMRLAQQIALNIKPILGSVDGSLKIILRQLIFYMISKPRNNSLDISDKKEIITTLRVFFKTLKEHGKKDLVRQVFGSLTQNSQPAKKNQPDSPKPIISNLVTRRQSEDIEEAKDSNRMSSRIIVFQGSPLIVDPSYIIPLIHSSLLEFESEDTSLDQSLKLGMTHQPFNPPEIIKIFAKIDRDLLKRQLYLYANICECTSATYSQTQTHRICLLLKEWEHYVCYSEDKEDTSTQEDHLVKAGLLRLLYTLLTVTDRSVVTNPKYVRYFSDRDGAQISAKCEKVVLGTDFTTFNNQEIMDRSLDKVEFTSLDQFLLSPRTEKNNNSQELSRSSPRLFREASKAKKMSMARTKEVEQGRPVLGSVLLSAQDIETLFDMESLDFAESLDPYTLRESHVEFMKIINYFLSAGILQYQGDFRIARRTLAIIIQAFHKYISVCTETEKEFEDKYTRQKLESLRTVSTKDVNQVLQEAEGFEFSQRKSVPERNTVKSFPKISSLDLHILELEVKMKKQEILESAIEKVRMQNEHPTLFRYFEILHTYLGLVNTCLNSKMSKKSYLKRLETEKKRNNRKSGLPKLSSERDSPTIKISHTMTTDALDSPTVLRFDRLQTRKGSAGRRTSITGDQARGSGVINSTTNMRTALSYDDTLQSKVMIEICFFFRNLLEVDYDRVLTEYSDILKTHFFDSDPSVMVSSQRARSKTTRSPRLPDMFKGNSDNKLGVVVESAKSMKSEEGQPLIVESRIEDSKQEEEVQCKLDTPLQTVERNLSSSMIEMSKMNRKDKKAIEDAVKTVSDELINHLFNEYPEEKEARKFRIRKISQRTVLRGLKRDSTVQVEKFLIREDANKLERLVENDQFDHEKIPKFFLVGPNPGRRVVIIEALCEWFNSCKSQELRKEIALLMPRLIYHKRDVMRTLVKYFSLFDTIIDQELYISVLSNLSFIKLKLNELESWRSLIRDETQIDDHIDSMSVNQTFHPANFVDLPSQKEREISRLIQSLKVIRNFLTKSPVAGIQQLDPEYLSTSLNDLDGYDEESKSFRGERQRKEYAHYLNLGQLWLRETGGYRIIMELLLKATNIRTKALRVCYEVFKYDEFKPPPLVAAKAIELFTISADIITLFIRENQKNKALITKNLVDLVPFFHEEFISGQIYDHCLPAQRLNGALIRMLKEAVTDNPMLAGEERLVYTFVDALNTRLSKNKLINLLVLFTGVVGSTHDPEIAEYCITYLLQKRSLKDLGADDGLLYTEVRPYLVQLRRIIIGNQFRYAIEKYNALNTQLQKTLAINNRVSPPQFREFHQDDLGYLSLKNIPGIKMEDELDEPQNVTSFTPNDPYSSQYETEQHVPQRPPSLLQLRPVEQVVIPQRKVYVLQNNEVVSERRYDILQKIRSFILTSEEVKKKIEQEEEHLITRLFGEPNDQHKLGKTLDKRKVVQTKKRRQHIIADFISYIKREIEVMEDENDPESLSIPQDHSGVKLGLSLLSRVFQKFTSKKMGMLNLLVIELLVKILNASYIPSVIPLMAQVLYFANILVGDGDEEIQSKFYECFKKTEGNQHFGYISSLLERAIHSLNSGSSKAILSKRTTPFEFVIDENYEACFFLKSLCEGHHQEFQSFLTDQHEHLHNQDMISLVVEYLQSLISRVKGKADQKFKFSQTNVGLSHRSSGRQYTQRRGGLTPRLLYHKVEELSGEEKSFIFVNAQMCLVALTQFVQGPCFPNQLRVVEADYLLCAKIILRDLHFTFDKHPTAHGLSNLQVLLLKSACVLCLLSLIEQRGPNDVLLKAIRSEIKLSNIEHHIVYCYFAFDQLMGGKFVTNDQYFGPEQGRNNEMYTLEPAFNFFVFALKMNEVELKLDKKYKPKGLFEHTTIKKDNLSDSIFGALINCYNDIQHTRIDQESCPKTLDALSESTFKQKFYEYEEEAGQFFSKHTAKIEILNNGNMEEIYFPRAPSYKNLNAEQKQAFIYSLELEKELVQMDSVIEQGDALIEKLRGEYRFKKFFSQYGLLGVVLFYSNLWKTLGYYTTLLINFCIFVSYTDEHDSNRFQPHLFLSLPTFWTQAIFYILGLVMVGLACAGNFLLITNKLPQHIDNTFKRVQGSKKINREIQISQKSTSQLILGSIQLFFSITGDMPLLYDILYVICAFMGLFISHIFYSFHMLDVIVRSPLLVNILKSLWRPRRELLLTLVLFLVIEYVFTTFSYWYFGKDYPLNECISIISCFMTNVDQTFKNDGGIGAYMELKVGDSQEGYDSTWDIPFARIFFDQLFNLMLVILIVQIIAAIMIDTFGALRDETSTIRELITTSCIVCGKTRDEIERDEENFDYHIKVGLKSEIQKKHNLFNYIMFLAYLKRKNKIDLTGSESYVWEMYQDEDPRWFPIYMRRVGGKKKDDEVQDEPPRSDGVSEMTIKENNKMLKRLMEKVEKLEQAIHEPKD